MQNKSRSDLWTGPLVAAVIISLWVSSLVISLSADLTQWTLLSIVPAVLGRTFIQTGLFIVVHDAIHGSVFPKSRLWNHRIGNLAITLYGFLPYEKLALNHWKHHRSPGQPDDPDFHDGVHRGFLAWYIKFMTDEYVDAELRRKLLLYMAIAFVSLRFGLQVSGLNLFLFWLLPLILSSLQLFYFGTYLPHRSSNNYDSHNSHNAVSSNFPTIVSFFTCYHFGYHWEHHEYPDIAWYKLPQAHHSRQHQAKAAIANSAS
ncbi:fatty acid desaturase [Phormidium sp. CLA17]|uniref:fatty acid desaturase n=1 Tax=Leptolyngbya sp. Cla-17 TaxID=2803751 RepID=UPI0018D7262A|nr:fatty acid desaturase [Leptolyngbya sp. Cla-17]MBM0743987.1 fatty acid desaturase [Leptolyngbya sp. Cla-17]